MSGPTRRGLSYRETTREEKLRAVTAVLRGIPDPGAQREVLDALFAEGRKQLHHGDKPSKVWAAARQEWLDRVRAWMQESGRKPFSTQIPSSVQEEYVKATGDVFVPPAGDPRARRRGAKASTS